MPIFNGILGSGALGSFVLGDGISAFENLDFETAGTQIGRAASWAITSVVTPFEFDGFDVDTLGFDGFEQGWGDVVLSFDEAAFEAASFATSFDVETFDRQWGPFDNALDDYGEKVLASANLGENSVPRFAWGASVAAAFGSHSFENFENGWSNDDFAFSIGDITTTTASFDTVPESFEDFEEGWSNDAFIYDFAGATFSIAVFDATENFEDFEELRDGDEIFDVLSVLVGRYFISINGTEFDYTASMADTVPGIATQLVSRLSNSNFQITATVIDSTRVMVKNNGSVPMVISGAGPTALALARTTLTERTTMWMLPLYGV